MYCFAINNSTSWLVGHFCFVWFNCKWCYSARFCFFRPALFGLWNYSGTGSLWLRKVLHTHWDHGCSLCDWLTSSAGYYPCDGDTGGCWRTSFASSQCLLLMVAPLCIWRHLYCLYWVLPEWEGKGYKIMILWLHTTPAPLWPGSNAYWLCHIVSGFLVFSTWLCWVLVWVVLERLVFYLVALPLC